MRYQPYEMTERIKKTKEIYMSLTVPTMTDPYHPTKYRCYRSGDRLMTLGYLRGFEKHLDAPTTRMRTSYAEAEELYESKPQIFDNELLLGHLYLPDYTDEEQAEYDRLCDSFAMSAHTLKQMPPRKDHIGLDFEKLLRVGVTGLKNEIKEKLSSLDLTAADLYPDLDAIKQYEFYQCCLIELDAVSDLARRYAEEALRTAEEKPEPRRSELIHLGNMLKKVPDEPATTFYEAVQSVQFFLSTLFGLFPLGRPDRYLYPFYQQDIENGTLTREFAQELVDNLCLYVSDRVFTRAACGFIVGGYDANGNLVENDLTYLFITALDHLKLPDPNGALAVNKDTGAELLEYCAEVLSHGTSHPAFYNDQAIINSLMKNYNVPLEDAVNYIHSTCAEITVVGKSKGYTTSFSVDLPKLLCEAVTEGNVTEFDGLLQRFLEKIADFMKQKSLYHTVRVLEAARNGNDAMRISTLIDDCIARGKSIYEGGVRYTFLQPIFVGFATAVDSLLALQSLVFTDKKLSLEEFDRIVSNNFEGEERLRQYLIHKLPHYGNDDEVADAMAKRLASECLKLVDKKDITLWEHMMPGTFTYINHAAFGGRMGATFDGRLAETSYSDGCSPVQGRDTNGPTALIGSLTSWDQSRMLGGMVVNLKFGSENLNGSKAKKFITLLHTFIERGGIEMQVNVVDRATLEDAKRNPEAHRDLLVRIGGYSDYFIRLKPVLQDEIIQRTEY